MKVRSIEARVERLTGGAVVRRSVTRTPFQPPASATRTATPRSRAPPKYRDSPVAPHEGPWYGALAATMLSGKYAVESCPAAGLPAPPPGCRPRRRATGPAAGLPAGARPGRQPVGEGGVPAPGPRRPHRLGERATRPDQHDELLGA